MGEVIGIGATHYPPLMGKRMDNYANVLHRHLSGEMGEKVPEHMKDPKNWPEEMQREWANEMEVAAEHKERHIAGFRKVRQALDDFNPDVVILFGNDQAENWHEDVIPAFHIWIADEIPTRRFGTGQQFCWKDGNHWDEPDDLIINYKSNKDLARHIATELIEQEFPISYSYKDLHYDGQGMVHAFTNTLMYMDWDRKGWDYPVIPIHMNGHGKDVLRRRLPGELVPPGPTPKSCFRLGKMIRQIVDERPERVAFMAGASWSHAFLLEKTGFLYPDLEFDRQHVEDLKINRHDRWGEITNQEIDDSGDAEFKLWIALAGTVADADVELVDYLDNYIFNSPKCFAIFRPNGG